MRIAEVNVNSKGEGIAEALSETEKLAVDIGLERTEIMHLRLLAEELIGMLKSYAYDVDAVYRAALEDRKFCLSLDADILMTQEMHDELIAISKTGKNESARGFMGRLKELIGMALLPSESKPTVMGGLSLSLMSMGSPGGYQAGSDSARWSLQNYRKNAKEEQIAELEKSIVASIADDVTVAVDGDHVRLAVYKQF